MGFLDRKIKQNKTKNTFVLLMAPSFFNCVTLGNLPNLSKPHSYNIGIVLLFHSVRRVTQLMHMAITDTVSGTQWSFTKY